MSAGYNTPVPCPRCGAENSLAVADSVSATRAPWMREAILADEFHRFRCRACEGPITVEKELLYTDLPRGHWVGVFPPLDLPRFKECEGLVQRTFREAMFERAPPFVASWADRIEVRVVFGLPELREKLLCWQHGLDDRIVELMKMDLLGDRPALVREGVVGLRLDAVFQTGLGFITLLHPEAASGPQLLHAPRDVYDAVAAARPALSEAHGELLAGPFVSLLRYLPLPSPEAGPPRATLDRHTWRDGRPL